MPTAEDADPLEREVRAANLQLEIERQRNEQTLERDVLLANLQLQIARQLEQEKSELSLERNVENANLQLEIERRLKAESRLEENYPLPYRGYLRERLPEDGRPALVCSEVFWPQTDPATHWVHLWKPLHGIAMELGHKGLCHDASILVPTTSSGNSQRLFHHLQALDLCVHEFADRPAVVVFHTGDAVTVDSYALVWQFGTSGIPGGAQLVQVGRLSRLETAKAVRRQLRRFLRESEEDGPVEESEDPLAHLEALWAGWGLPFAASIHAQKLMMLPVLGFVGSLLECQYLATGGAGAPFLEVLGEGKAKWGLDESGVERIERLYAEIKDEMLPPRMTVDIKWDAPIFRHLRALVEAGFEAEILETPEGSILKVKLGSDLIFVQHTSSNVGDPPTLALARGGGSAFESLVLGRTDWQAAGYDLVSVVSALSN